MKHLLLLLTTMSSSDNDRLKSFIEKIPKVELHAHLNGCAREASLFELAQERNVELPTHHFALPSSSNKDDSLLYNAKPRSLRDCFDMFAEIPKCVNDLDALRRITQEALEDFSIDHVAYLELRSTPKRLRRTWKEAEFATKKEYIETVISELERFSKREEERYERESASSSSDKLTRLPLMAKFIVSIDRAGTVDEAMEHAQLATDLANSGHRSMLVGVDLGGNPSKNDFRDFLPAFELARHAGLSTTIHCGEVSYKDAGDSKISVIDEIEAILAFRPNRLGHALLLPPSLDARLRALGIPVESCPTSNVMTLELAEHFHGSLIHGLKRHPQQAKWLLDGYPIAICTDDPGVFDTTLSKELFLMALAFDLGEAEIKQLVVDSIEYAFCSKEEKGFIEREAFDASEVLD
jgi:adenosine deaminase